MGYATIHWAGLDVMTMHVIAYPTVALLLYQIGGAKGGSYQKLHWAPKLITGFFVIITIILGGLVYIAGKGIPPTLAHWLLPNIEGKVIHTGFSGVVAHGEEASKSIAQQLSMADKLARLGWRVEVIGLDVLRPGTPGNVRVKVSNQQGQAVPGVRVSMGLGRLGQALQNRIQFSPLNDGSFEGQIVLPAAGEWLTVLTLEQGSNQINLERPLGGE
jgi:hypothetical protein